MADIVMNVALGRVNEYWRRVVNNDPAASVITIVLLKTAEADATLRDYDTLSALLAGSNVECDFTNYARVVFTDSDIVDPTVDDTLDRQTSAIVQKTITSAGGTLDNTIVKGIICYDPLGTDVDANMIPLTAQDASATTNGQDLVVAAANVYRASQP